MALLLFMRLTLRRAQLAGAPGQREQNRPASTIIGPYCRRVRLGFADYLRQPLSTRQTRSGPSTKP